MNEQLPLTPYAGTSGWSGSQTSKDRAERDDNGGVTHDRARSALFTLRMANYAGVTWKELAATYGWHHGQASGILSVLHKMGIIQRLSISRDRCKVYVLPEYRNFRDIEPHGSNKRKSCPHCGHDLP